MSKLKVYRINLDAEVSVRLGYDKELVLGAFTIVFGYPHCGVLKICYVANGGECYRVDAMSSLAYFEVVSDTEIDADDEKEVRNVTAKSYYNKVSDALDKTIRFDPQDDYDPIHYGLHKEVSGILNDVQKTVLKSIEDFLIKHPGESENILTFLKDIYADKKNFGKGGDNIEVGGQHYQMAIQPWDFIYANHIPFDEGSAIKYLCRHERKNGAEDVKKAISFCKHILKTQYNEDVDKD